ncbi:MAG: LysR family transcriptional regulator [Porticoccaceae bacterium]|nr:MAG: LysR family transcriptional regulator [Porticoccaceae bacterium]
MRLNYRHLYYFWRVAEVGNLSRAAEALHLSQSALSTQIRRLEAQLGVALFERIGRRLALTEAGRRVLAYADDIFTRGAELEAMVARGFTAERTHLHVGVLTTLSRNFVELFLAPLLADPAVTFTLSTHTMTGLLDGLAAHELDLALANRNPAGDGEPLWLARLVARQPVAVVGPPDGRPSGPFPRGYEGARWVLPAPASALRGAFDALCATWQYRPEVIAEADDMAMLRLLARDSGALAVVPPVVVVDEIAAGRLAVYEPLAGIFEPFYAITARRKYLPAAVGRLLRQMDLLKPGAPPPESPPARPAERQRGGREAAGRGETPGPDGSPGA